ncbi:PKD domain-containing protein, partial [Oceanihabitans sediminis]
MRYRSYIYTGVIFFIVVSSAIAFNRIHVVAENLIAPPTVSFSYNNNVCSGETVSFNSTVTGDGPFEYLWDFGDGATSTEEDPEYIYEAFGCGTQTFDVTLEVTDDNGETTTLTETVTVNEEPDINFIDVDSPYNPFDNCNAASVDYTITVGNDSNSDGCITTYSIDWGDGNVQTNVQFPLSHTYTSIGSFDMVITALGVNGCLSQETYLVKNSSNPEGGLNSPGSTTQLCLPLQDPINFTISSWGGNPADTVYYIDYGDGTTLTLTQNQLETGTDADGNLYYNTSNPSESAPFPIPYTYTTSNCPQSHYTVLLDVVTSCGETNFSVGPIKIHEKPDVSFNVLDSSCINESIEIENTSTSGYSINCTEADWFWDMGDGTTYNTFEPFHSYTAPGVYVISLYAANFCGETEIVTQEICIEAPLNPEFTSTTNESCAPFTTVLNNTTVVTDQCGVPVFEWD